MTLRKKITKIKTIYALGFNSLRRVLLYRLGVKFGFNSVKKINADIKRGDFFNVPDNIESIELAVNNCWADSHFYFGWKENKTKSVPNWHQNILTGMLVNQPELNWWEISDFDSSLGDIKGVWEASRFDWVICFAQKAVQGDLEALDKLNFWLNDWCENNPPYKGVNWKCGQEASIRIMHIAMAALILKQHKKLSDPLLTFIKAHLTRILPTINYAVGQDNNHGTSEAAALFIGGSCLLASGDSSGKNFYKKGRFWLEDRAKKLIEKDGSFSQYSTSYHRVMLDTYSMVEVWREAHSLPKFSFSLYERLSKASLWLFQIVQFDTGNAPNLGANDGARIIPLTDSSYRDFRQSVQLASVLFCKKLAWIADGSWNLPIKWLSITPPKDVLPNQSSFHFSDGGYSGLRGERGEFVLLTYPSFKFRPSQCDALHVDFWLNGINLLRDGGTYSYNAGEEYISYYAGSEGHNTIQFDNRDQMPRLSRFLLGDWLKVDDVDFDSTLRTSQAAYTDNFGAMHKRRISLLVDCLEIEDNISGFQERAVLRWRLSPGNWIVKDNVLSNGTHSLVIKSNVALSRFELKTGKESLYYYQESDIPVLEIEITQAGKITTEYQY